MKRARAESNHSAVLYTRVSTGLQKIEGVSLQAQMEKARAWCAANGFAIAGEFTDEGISGKRIGNRPGLQGALDTACRQRAALVVYSLSRLARSTKDAIAISERLDKAGADLVSLSERLDTTSASGKLVFRMMAVLAEFERDLIAERTASAMQYKRSKGEYTGGAAPYGWRVGADGVRLEADPVEQATLARAVELRAEGWSLRAIGRRLEAEGRPARGGRWHAKVLAAVLDSAPRATKAA